MASRSSRTACGGTYGTIVTSLTESRSLNVTLVPIRYRFPGSARKVANSAFSAAPVTSTSTAPRSERLTNDVAALNCVNVNSRPELTTMAILEGRVAKIVLTVPFLTSSVAKSSTTLPGARTTRSSLPMKSKTRVSPTALSAEVSSRTVR